MKSLTAALFALVLAACPVAANDDALVHGDLTFTDPFAFETTPAMKAAGGYFTVTNNGDTDIVITAAETDFSRTMLHKSEVDSDGVARMTHQHDGVRIPAGQTVEFAPGGLHVMFMGLDAPFVSGETRRVTLSFDKGEPVDLMIEVRARQ